MQFDNLETKNDSSDIKSCTEYKKQVIYKNEVDLKYYLQIKTDGRPCDVELFESKIYITEYPKLNVTKFKIEGKFTSLFQGNLSGSDVIKDRDSDDVQIAKAENTSNILVSKNFNVILPSHTFRYTYPSHEDKYQIRFTSLAECELFVCQAIFFSVYVGTFF